MNNGAPIKEVSIPTGRTIGAIMLRASKSAANKNTPPNKAVAGIRNLSSLPIIRRTRCGTTSPTKAIIPKNDTATAVVIDAINMT